MLTQCVIYRKSSLMKKILIALSLLSATLSSAGAWATQCTQNEALFVAQATEVQDNGDSCHVHVMIRLNDEKDYYAMNSNCPLIIEDVLFHGFDVAKTGEYKGENCGIKAGGAFLSGMLVQKDDQITLSQED